MGDLKKIKRILAGNLKKYRKRQHLTQEKAAERAGITYKYWQRLEMVSQSDLPSLLTLGKMARALETKISRLLEG